MDRPKTEEAVVETAVLDGDSLRRADDALLAELGYKAEFKREFSVSSRWMDLVWGLGDAHLSTENRNRCFCVFYHGCCRFGILHTRVWTRERCVTNRCIESGTN